ncbi:ABC transporter G family member 45 [Nymphaea thermarum]|nr:ABC transporter G family member 45 [Nymphaea thermarum]
MAHDNRTKPEILDDEGSRDEECGGGMLQEEDQAQFLARLRSRLDSLNIALPKIEIQFEELTVEAQEHEAGRRAPPNLWNTTVNFMQETLMSCVQIFGDERWTVKLLDDLSGSIKPSRMVLVLGRPGSGKTTLLRALAGKLEPGLKFKGSVTYNGSDVNGSAPKQASAYAAEANGRDVATHYMIQVAILAFNRVTLRPFENFYAHNALVDAYDSLQMLGLSTCAHTIVGDHMRRGISGGQIKRLSIGTESLASVFFFFSPNITRKGSREAENRNLQLRDIHKRELLYLRGTTIVPGRLAGSPSFDETALYFIKLRLMVEVPRSVQRSNQLTFALLLSRLLLLPRAAGARWKSPLFFCLKSRRNRLGIRAAMADFVAVRASSCFGITAKDWRFGEVYLGRVLEEGDRKGNKRLERMGHRESRLLSDVGCDGGVAKAASHNLMMAGRDSLPHREVFSREEGMTLSTSREEGSEEKFHDDVDGEMLVGPARAFFLDEISNGLDSSTTYKIVGFLREMAHLMDTTVVVTLLQPSPETFELFDDIILLGEGKIMYQGPREKALDFFESMGFECPLQKNMPDFLLEVTSGMHQPQYWAGKNQRYKHVMCGEFAKSFKSYNMDQFHYAELQKSASKELMALQSESSVVRKRDIFKISLSRELLLLKRNSAAYIFKSVQILLLAAIVTATFSRGKEEIIPIEDDLTRLLGAIYAGVVVLMFNGVVELTMMIMRLPVFYKQRDLQSYPGWAFLLPAAFLHVPITLFESTMWVLVTYFFIGFSRSPTRLFQLFLACCCIQESSVALNRFIAAIARTQVVANIIATAILVTVLVLGGFVISKDDIHPWWIWGFWASPATYAQNAIAVNEFLDERWSMSLESGVVNKLNKLRMGAFLLGLSLDCILQVAEKPAARRESIGALCGFCLFFNMLSAIALTYLKAPQKAHANFANTADNVEVHAQHGSIPLCLMNGSPEWQTSLPIQHFTLVFKNIDYYVDMPSEMRKYGSREKRLQLLKNVSGAFRPASLTALMGETGAGKTTLLDVLAGRKTGGIVEGKVSIAGHPKKQDTFSRVFGYCEQNDLHSPYITVYESLLFSASLRLPSEVTSETKNVLVLVQRFVHDVMDLVELKGMKGLLVGLSGAFGLGTDQRKRLTIAVELVANPSIIFIDEPTTGLDTPAASIVMRAIRRAADTGRTVVCTIHQPNIQTFETFDELLLMKRGGQLIYSGPLGSSAQDMIRYFESIPGVPSMRNGSNPAAWMLDVTSTDMEFELGIDFSERYCHSSLHKENMQLIQELSKASPGSEELKFTSRYAQSFKTQCIACYLKQQWSYWRNSEQNLNRILITLIISLLFGTMFWNIGLKLQKEQDLFDILGILYVSALFLGFVNCSSVQPIVWLERSVFYRERSSGMYSAVPYAIAQLTRHFSCIDAVLLIIMRSWTRWYYWLDPAAWTVYGLMVTQLKDRPEIVQMFDQQGQTAREFMGDYLGLKDDFIFPILGLHFAAIFTFLFVLAFSIKYLNFQRR